MSGYFNDADNQVFICVLTFIIGLVTMAILGIASHYYTTKNAMENGYEEQHDGGAIVWKLKKDKKE